MRERERERERGNEIELRGCFDKATLTATNVLNWNKRERQIDNFITERNRKTKVIIQHKGKFRKKKMLKQWKKV